MDLNARTAREDALMYTSMCVWEALTDPGTQEPDSWYALRLMEGAHAARQAAREFARVVEDAWDSLSEEQRDDSPAFDWELVPEMLAQFRPDQDVTVEEMAAAMGEFIAAELARGAARMGGEA